MIPDYRVQVHDGVKRINFNVLAEVGDYDYSWWAKALLQRASDGALFIAEDAGCSCNYFLDYATVTDLIPVHSFSEALKRIDAKHREKFARSYEQGRKIDVDES